MIGEVAAPNLWRVRELRAMLVDAGITLVHAHGMFSTLAIGSLLAAHGAGIPSVTTHHSLLRHSPTLPAAWITYRLFSRRATVVTAVSHAAAVAQAASEMSNAGRAFMIGIFNSQRSERAEASEPAERREASKRRASDAVGGTAGAKPPGCEK